MEFHSLIAALPGKKGAVYAFERGKTVRHPHAALYDDAARVREDLRAWGVKQGSRVGIYAPNSYYWLVHDIALIQLGAISVAFTDDFAGKINRELLDKYNVALLLISKRDARLFPSKPAYVAFIDSPNEDSIQALQRPPSGDPDEADHHSLVFSSGSAGGLKGLVISRKGIEVTVPPIFDALGLGPGDRFLLFLPMSNFQQRNMCYAALWYDYDIIVTDYTQLFAAMPALSPTHLLAPPMFFQMVYGEYEKYPAWKKSLWSALGSILSLVPSPGFRQSLARLFFRDFHKQFGSRMRMLVTGMAPIRGGMGKFFENMQLPLCESYGMMEAGSLTFRPAESKSYSSVGKPIKGVNLSIAPDGEVIVEREASLTLRYFQCAEGENERTFLGVGRIATGDIGKLDDDGNLYLLGRKKELLVTPGGIKIHPETIEQEINNSPGVAHAVVFLKPNSAHLTCVVDLVPPASEEARVRVTKFANNLPSARKAAQFVEVIFADQPFTVENGMMRPNLKIDRKAITARYSS